MANTAQATKRARQAQAHMLNNNSQKSAMRTSIKKVLKLIETDLTAAKTEFKQMVKMLDTIARRGLFHPNKAARLKSRISKKLKLAQK